MDWENRITSERIDALQTGQVFVFGSNQAGRHGKGAARQALDWGAQWGQASGLQGHTYGIPTKDKSVYKPLSLVEIEDYVDEFIEFAKNNEQHTFLVTEIGCGLAGLNPKDIAPLFAEAIKIENIHLPGRFWEFLLKQQ